MSEKYSPPGNYSENSEKDYLQEDWATLAPKSEAVRKQFETTDLGHHWGFDPFKGGKTPFLNAKKRTDLVRTGLVQKSGIRLKAPNIPHEYAESAPDFTPDHPDEAIQSNEVVHAIGIKTKLAIAALLGAISLAIGSQQQPLSPSKVRQAELYAKSWVKENGWKNTNHSTELSAACSSQATWTSGETSCSVLETITTDPDSRTFTTQQHNLLCTTDADTLNACRPENSKPR